MIPSPPNAGLTKNVTYVQEFVVNLLQTDFFHLSDNQIKIIVTDLFNLDHDILVFKVEK